VSWLITPNVDRTTIINEANEWLPHFNEYLNGFSENLKLLQGLTYQAVEYFLLTASHRYGRVVHQYDRIARFVECLNLRQIDKIGMMAAKKLIGSQLLFKGFQ